VLTRRRSLARDLGRLGRLSSNGKPIELRRASLRAFAEDANGAIRGGFAFAAFLLVVAGVVLAWVYELALYTP
jgi:hypothetical protein